MCVCERERQRQTDREGDCLREREREREEADVTRETEREKVAGQFSSVLVLCVGERSSQCNRYEAAQCTRSRSFSWSDMGGDTSCSLCLNLDAVSELLRSGGGKMPSWI